MRGRPFERAIRKKADLSVYPKKAIASSGVRSGLPAKLELLGSIIGYTAETIEAVPADS